MEYRKIARLSMLLALSILLGILESFLPIVNGLIPGVKIGFANIIIVITLYIYGVKEAFILAFLRILLMGFLKTGVFSTTFFFSLGGTFCSVGAMSLVYHRKLSIIGTSMVGSIFHSMGQLIVAVILLKLPTLIFYLPWMILFSILTGSIIGYLAKYMMTRLQSLKIEYF